MKLDNNTRDYITKKINTLEKYLGSVKAINCDIEVGIAAGDQKSGNIFRAEVNLAVPGEILRVEKTEKDLLKAVDKVKDHLARSIKRYKEKRIDKKRKLM